jgi:hypothetical protein
MPDTAIPPLITPLQAVENLTAIFNELTTFAPPIAARGYAGMVSHNLLVLRAAFPAPADAVDPTIRHPSDQG